MRTPRAQSAAGIGRRPTGRTSPSSTGAGRRADQHPALLDVQLAGLELGDVGRVDRPHRAEPEPLAAEGRPRPGLRGDGADQPVDGRSAAPPSRPARRRRSPSARARRPRPAAARATSVPSAMPSTVAASSAAPGRGQPAQQVARGVGGRDGLGDHAVHRAGVEPLLQPEGGGAGDLVAVPERGLHGRRAAPGGQQREVQVDPAVPGHVQRRARHQRAVGDDRAAVRRQRRAACRGTPARTAAAASAPGSRPRRPAPRRATGPAAGPARRGRPGG